MIRQCRKCKKEKPIKDFGKDKGYKDGYTTLCRKCKAIKDRKKYDKNKDKYIEWRRIRRANKKLVMHDRRKHKEWIENNMIVARLASARASARKRGLEFNIDSSDIQMPTHCPLLGIILKKSTENNRDSSPSIDRINPKKGYIKGNVWITSYRANRIKNDATVEELRMIADNLEKKIYD